jgi:hypothetical protein
MGKQSESYTTARLKTIRGVGIVVARRKATERRRTQIAIDRKPRECPLLMTQSGT